MNTKKDEKIAILTQLSAVAYKLSQTDLEDGRYAAVSKMATRLAELEKLDISEDMSIAILFSEGLISKEIFEKVSGNDAGNHVYS